MLAWLALEARTMTGVRWDRSNVLAFLERLRLAAGYASVSEMVRRFNFDPSTPRKWASFRPKRRDEAPPAFRRFLPEYARAHQVDPAALLERWDVQPLRPGEAGGTRTLELILESINKKLDRLSLLDRLPAIEAALVELKDDPPPRHLTEARATRRGRRPG